MMPRRSRRVTIYDVAKDTGVAISTVSRVLNDAPDVSDTTRARIFEAIERLRYRPNRTAKRLAQQRTPTVAIALPSFTTPAHMELLKGVRDRLRGEDVDFLISDLGSSDPVDELRRFMQRGAVDGLLVAGVDLPSRLAEQIRSHCRAFVAVGLYADGADSFTWSHAAAARLAVTHLIRQGHTRIGMISTPRAGDSTQQRLDGYRKALWEAGLPFDPELVRVGRTTKHAGVSEESGYEAMVELLDLQPRVTGVFAGSDAQAVGARQAVSERGLTLGRDLALVGLDNLKISDFLGLSTVDLGVHDIGYRATDLMMRRLSGALDTPPLARVVTPRLVVRTSSLRNAA